MRPANTGSRTSRLQLDRLATGELAGAEAEALRARLEPEAQAHLQALDGARAALPPLDLGAIRARAARLPAEPVAEAPALPPAANGYRAFLALLVLAAVVLLGFVAFESGSAPAPHEGGDVRFRGGEGLEILAVEAGRPHPYAAGTPVGEGQVLGFRVEATGHRSVVLLSVDGRGETTVFWPESGDAPEPLAGDGLVPLSGSVVLDDAPGPEVFVAVYDRDVPSALALVKDAFATGGPAAVKAAAEATPGMQALEVTRK